METMRGQLVVVGCKTVGLDELRPGLALEPRLENWF